MNELKNVEIIERALYKESGRKIKFIQNGAMSRIVTDKNANLDYIEVETVTLDDIVNQRAIRRSILKMDIEGSEKYAFKSANFIKKIREISMELHGRENIGTIPMVLEHNGFMVSTYSTSDEIKESLKSVIHHPLDFYRLERQSNYVALRGLFGATRGKNPISSLSDSEFKIIYASRIV